jgi:hypothetical protein
METPNQTVYDALKTITGVASVGVASQNVFPEFPALTYMVVNNSVERDLDNEISGQTIEVVVDIWTQQSVKASDLLVLVEAKMRSLDYTLVFSGDVPNPNDKIYHITSRFRTVNV